ncbi:hypothetical protein H2200_009114 [Cladophialophora chaetospira]|uniref:Plasma membrane proteolipid 3 n=1 Tax=Cladophialophora chaetospira TaxID=386627 RepID=A0AA38X3J6_9EURO|nr:hypothetical protein H2200_009114 [Cladophialophora chaetospira]
MPFEAGKRPTSGPEETTTKGRGAIQVDIKGQQAHRRNSSAIHLPFANLDFHIRILSTISDLHKTIKMWFTNFLLCVLAIIFPPLAVAIKAGGCCTGDVCLTFLFSWLGYLPGVFYAWYIIARYAEHEDRKYQKVVKVIYVPRDAEDAEDTEDEKVEVKVRRKSTIFI